MPFALSPQMSVLILTIALLAVPAAIYLLLPTDRYGYKDLFRALQETTFDSVFLLNGQGQIKMANEVAVGTFGVTANALLGRNLSTLFVRDDAAERSTTANDPFLEDDFYRNSHTMLAKAMGAGRREFQAEIRVRPVSGFLRPRFVVVVRGVEPVVGVEETVKLTSSKYRRLFNTTFEPALKDSSDIHSTG